MVESSDILYLSHGGGPLPLLGDPGHEELVAVMGEMSGRLARPEAILIISAHWETDRPTITAGAKPELIYDYHGFPPESYAIEYSCPGEPELARQVHAVLAQAGIAAQLDHDRGFDHGVFVPLKVMYPAADSPCVQLSLRHNLSAQAHLELGRALRALAWSGLLVIGSGSSFHNMRAFFAQDKRDIRPRNLAFENWLQETCTDPSLEETVRGQRLADWHLAPQARFCHPREEHLLPLHVCYGLAGRACDRYIPADMMGVRTSLLYWSRQQAPAR